MVDLNGWFKWSILICLNCFSNLSFFHSLNENNCPFMMLQDLQLKFINHVLDRKLLNLAFKLNHLTSQHYTLHYACFKNQFWKTQFCFIHYLFTWNFVMSEVISCLLSYIQYLITLQVLVCDLISCFRLHKVKKQ
jgi:hypothetical protein